MAMHETPEARHAAPDTRPSPARPSPARRAAHHVIHLVAHVAALVGLHVAALGLLENSPLLHLLFIS
jgi:hypothetical protein